MNFDPTMSKNEHVKQAKDGLDVWNDIYRYAKTGYASIAEDDFTRMRWFGIYRQKPNQGHFMWRIRIPGGRLTPGQLREIGQLTNQYARGFGDVTVRQDIQLHWLTIENFPDLLDRVHTGLGLHAEFSSGDTPRNICSCPLDGLIKDQIVEMGDTVQRLSEMFRAGGKEFSNLPRKFKMTVAACPLHCHQPQINDVGVFGVVRADGSRGVGVMVGGGLSSVPYFAQGLRVFIPEKEIGRQLPDVMRHACHIFRDTDALRFKRNHARLKFLVDEKGWAWFREELERRMGYALEHDETIVNPGGALHTDHVGIGEQANGLCYVGVAIERGRWSGERMIAAADLAERYAAPGQAQIRLSQKQNVILVNIPRANVDELVRELTDAGMPPNAPLWRQSLLSCTGTQFCNLAVVETKQRAAEILKYLEEHVTLDSPIMVSVSGCPNSCAQYQVADIGLTGTKAQFEGLKVDAYDLCVGGSFGESPRFVRQIIPKVPSPVIHKVIGQLVSSYKAKRLADVGGNVETFRDFAARHTVEELRRCSIIPEWTPPPPRKVDAE